MQSPRPRPNPAWRRSSSLLLRSRRAGPSAWRGPCAPSSRDRHKLPDLVLALHGLIDFDAVGRIDSVNGGIRNTFDFVPDALVSEVVVNFQGGKKGLIVNSTDLCRAKHRAIVKFNGHNGKRHNVKPLLRAKCGGKGKRNHKGRQGKGK